MFKGVSVALCDPRLMREFTFLARLLGLDYSIPSFREGIQPTGNPILADEECIKAYNLKKASTLAVNKANLAKVLFDLLGGSTKVLLVGVDPGKKLAYVVLNREVVCSKGYVSTVGELLEIINSLVRKLHPRKVIIKVGEQGKDKAYELSKIISSDLYELHLVPEDKTNIKNLYLALENPQKFSRDFIAALNIALKMP